MQRGIDAYFKKVTNETSKPPLVKKRKVIISSDEEDTQASKKVAVEDKISKNSKTPLKAEKKYVDPLKFFGDDEIKNENDTITKYPNKTSPTVKETNAAVKVTPKANKTEIDLKQSTRQEKKESTTPNTAKTSKLSSPKKKSPKTPKSESPNKKKPKLEKLKAKEDLKVELPLNKTIKVKKEENSPFQESKRKYHGNAALFHQMQNRPSVLNPGSKEIPKGNPNCLSGLTFLVTGVLDCLERDEACNFIQEMGGKISKTVGKKLNYLVAGEEPGPKKMQDAETLGIKIINEDELFALVCEKSNLPPPKPKVKEEIDISVNDEIKIKEENTTPIKETQNKTQQIEENEKIDIVENKPIVQNKDEVNFAFVDKYKPSTIKDIIGQQGDNGNVQRLKKWLLNWYKNQNGKKLTKPSPWAKNDDGAYFKAALLSGPPGVGKTTTATLVCKDLCFDTVEMNASDTRNKRLLKEEVTELLTNKSLHGYFNGKMRGVTKQHVLIMDEVDGMAGNEDRGGIAELISLIKETKVPIICMCNDRNHQKMRSLVNYCFDLRFNKPRVEQIKGRLLSICHREKIKIDGAKLQEIILATNNDIRQSINHVAFLSAGGNLNLTPENTKKDTTQKDIKIGSWDVVRKIFSLEENKRMNIHEKSDLFFHDYSLNPLFVQQNYLNVAPAVAKDEVITQVALAADSLSLGDLIDKNLRSNSNWALLPTMAMLSFVLPAEYMRGRITGQIAFPGWLGKNSRQNKLSRLAQELHDHTRLRTSGSRLSMRLDYAPYLLSKIVNPLKRDGVEGIPEAIDVLKQYQLLREDIESLIELTTWQKKGSIWDGLDSRVKSAFTRAYNKDMTVYSYSTAISAKKKRVNVNSEPLVDEEEEEDEMDDDDDENPEKDTLIMTKKKETKKPTKAKETVSKKKK